MSPALTVQQPLHIESSHSSAMAAVAPSIVRQQLLLYGVMCLMGVGTLLPWSVFISVPAYFAVRVQQPPRWDSLAANFESIIVLVFQICNFGALLALLPVTRHLTLATLVRTPLLANAAFLSVSAALAWATHVSGKVVAATTLPAIGLTGITTACLQAGCYVLSSHFPPIQTQAVLVGQAVAGLGIALVSFVTIWALPPASQAVTPQDVSAPALAYFLIAVLVSAVCVAAYMAMWRLPYVTQHCQGEGLDSEAAAEDIPTAPAQQQPPTDQAPLLAATEPAASSSADAELGEATVAVKQWTPLDVASELRGYIAAVALTFVVTLAVFPGTVSLICSSHSTAMVPPCTPHPHAGRFYGELFVPFLFVLFNLGDLLGRAAACYGPWAVAVPPSGALLAYAAARALPAAALLLCNVLVPGGWLPLLLFGSDSWPLLLTLALGFTNGHLASVALMWAPHRLPSVARAQSGSVMAFSVTAGITAGSILALPLMRGLSR